MMVLFNGLNYFEIRSINRKYLYLLDHYRLYIHNGTLELVLLDVDLTYIEFIIDPSYCCEQHFCEHLTIEFVLMFKKYEYL